MYTPDGDLTAAWNILGSDLTILSLLDLTGDALIKRANAYIARRPDKPLAAAQEVIISQSIIKRSTWDDLASSDKRLCVYFVPARRTKNESFYEDILEFDCHVPASEDYKAWQVQERIFKLFHKQKLNNRYLYAEPPLGELPTMPGFFCCGTRFTFYRAI